MVTAVLQPNSLIFIAVQAITVKTGSTGHKSQLKSGPTRSIKQIISCFIAAFSVYFL